MSETLPLFPLGTVLYPGLLLPLHIFEDRYRQLVRDLLDGPIASVVELLREDGSGRGARRRGSRGEGPIDRGDRVA